MNALSLKAVLLLTFFIFNHLSGQIMITMDDFLPDHEVCGDAQTLFVTLTPEEILTGLVNIQLDFPTGVNYVSNTLNFGFYEGLSFELTNIGNNNMQFQIEIADEWNAGESFAFAVDRDVNCLAIAYAQNGGTFEDQVTVSVGNNELEETGPPYGVLFGFIDVNILMNAQTFFEITNSGLGEIQGFEGSFVIPDFWEFEGLETLGGESIPTIESGGIHYFELPNITFGNGETVLVELLYSTEGNNCLPSDLIVNANWGCNEQICNESSTSAEIEVQAIPFIAEEGVYDYDLTKPTSNCSSFEMAHVFENESLTGAIFDFQFLCKNLFATAESIGPSDVDLYTYLDAIEIDGMNVPFIETEDGLMADFTNFTEPFGPLEDLDNDGFYDDLPANTSIVISTFLGFSCPDEVIQNYSEYRYFRGEFTYSNECGEDFERKKNIQLPNLSLEEMSEKGAVDFWADGEDYRISLCYGYRLERFNCETSHFNMHIVVPPGFYLSETAGAVSLLGGEVGDYYQSNDTIYVEDIVKYNSTSIPEYICIDVLLNLVCEAESSPAPNIEWEISYVCDEDCSCIWRMGESSFQVFTHDLSGGACTGSGGGGGGGMGGLDICDGVCLMTKTMSAERASFGFSDYTFNEYVDPDTIAIKDFAWSCDSILVKTSGLVVGDGEITQPYIRIFHDDKFENHILDFLSGVVDVYDEETGDLYSCELPLNAVSYGVWDTLYYADLNLSSLLGDCLPFSTLTEGDSLVLQTFFKIDWENDLDLEDIIDMTHFRSIHYHISSNDEMCACDHVGQRFYVKDPYVRDGTSKQFTGNFCDGYELEIGFGSTSSTYGDFPQEIRPIMMVNELELELPVGVEYEVGSSQYQHPPNPLEWVTISDPEITFSEEGAQILTYQNDGTWPIGWGEIAAAPKLFLKVSPKVCEFDSQMNFSFKYIENYFSTEDCHTYLEYDGILYGNAFGLEESVASVEVQENTTLPLNGGDINYGFEYCNESSDEFTNVFALIYSKNLVVTEASMGNIVLLNDSTSLVELGDLNAQSCLDFDFDFEIINCGLEPFVMVDIGWQCSDYPTTWKEYDCELSILPTEFVLEVGQSEIQLDVTGPGAAVNLCEDFEYEILLNSAQDANVKNIEVLIDLPEAGGLDLSEVQYIEYPIGSTLRPFTAEIIDNQIVIDLGVANAEIVGSNFLDLTNDGLLGLEYGNNESRQAKLHLSFITDCNFIAGSQFLVSVTGDRLCGDPAIGSGSTQLVEPVNIAGVVPTFSTQITIESDTLVACDETHLISVALKNLGPEEVTEGSNLSVFLPKGMHFESTDNPNFNLIAETTLTNSSRLDFTLTQDLAIEETLLAELTVGLDLQEFCTDKSNLDLQVQSLQIVTAECVASGQNCELQIQTNNNAFFEVPVKFPQAEITVQEFTVNCGNNETSEFLFLMNNTGNLPFESLINFSVFEDVNNNGPDASDVLLFELTDTVSLDANFSDLISFTPENLPALDGQNIYVKALSPEFCYNCNEIIAFAELVENNVFQNVSGILWIDENTNGMVDTGESLLAETPVVIINTETNSTMTSLTDEFGAFNFESLPLGEWELTVSEQQIPDNVLLDQNIMIEVNLADCGTTFEQNIPFYEDCSTDFIPTPICVDGENTYQVHIFAANGVPPFTFTGAVDTTVNSFGFNIIGDPIEIGEDYSITITDAQGCSTVGQGTFSCAALSFNETQLTGRVGAEGNHLSWSIPGNSNRKQLLIERSWEGENWKNIKTLSQNSNNYLDPFLASGTLIYQLKEILFSGETAILSTISLERKTNHLTLIEISPNPSKGKALMIFNSPQKENGALQLIDINGKVVYEENQVKLEKGLNKIDLDLTSFPKGIYYVQLVVMEETIVERIIRL